MIRITLDLRPGHTEIRCEGHSNASDPDHKSICAGVSAIMQAAALGLDALAREYPEHVRVEVKPDG